MGRLAPTMPLPESPDDMVRSAPELEALPIVAQRVLSIVRDDEATTETIAGVLGTDQALAAAVLRYANSARAMPNRRIANLREAVARIGRRALGEVLVRACAGPMLDRGLPPYALPRRVAWRHAATTSVAARQLAEVAHAAGGEEASVAGLLHDVGKMVLTTVVPEAAAKAVSISRSRHMPVWQAEVEVLGFHHGAVGAAMLRSWGLPEVVSDAVAYHHEPGRTSNPLAGVLYLADAAAHAVGAVGGGGACPQPEWEPHLAEALGASAEDCQRILDELQCVEEGAL
jgi:putative nucleotidyltransferase with HDIG domain